MAQTDSDADSSDTGIELDPEVFRDVYLRLRCDLLVIGDSIITDRHHASGDNYEKDDPQNQIGGVIPSFSLSGWLRHGMERVIIERGGTACHPGEEGGNFRRSNVYDRDLEDGYHEKGTCIDGSNSAQAGPADLDSESGCVVFDLHGGFGGIRGKFMRRPIQFSPVRSNIDYTRGQAEGHYREINRNIVSRNEADQRIPLRPTKYDAVANLDGSWQLSFREIKPEFIGLLAEASEFLDRNQTEFMHQLGGARNFGGGIVDLELINPLYSETELSNVFARNKSTPTEAMEEKDEEWDEQYLPELKNSLDERINRPLE